MKASKSSICNSIMLQMRNRCCAPFIIKHMGSFHQLHFESVASDEFGNLPGIHTTANGRSFTSNNDVDERKTLSELSLKKNQFRILSFKKLLSSL